MYHKNPSKHITPRQLQLLKNIASFASSHCYSPTITELAEQLNLSRSTIFEHIAELRKKGLLRQHPFKARSLELTTKALRLLKSIHEQTNIHTFDEGIPLAGRIAAGEPIEAVEDKQFLRLGDFFGRTDNIFALEVIGDSMIEAGIYDGDYVICRRTCTAEDGQIVVAITDKNNATLKRFYREKNCLRLQPANKNYKPIYSQDCEVQAVVIGVLRKI